MINEAKNPRAREIWGDMGEAKLQEEITMFHTLNQSVLLWYGVGMCACVCL